MFYEITSPYSMREDQRRVYADNREEALKLAKKRGVIAPMVQEEDYDDRENHMRGVRKVADAITSEFKRQ